MLKLSDVAQRLNCSLSNVYALVESGRLDAVQIGATGKGYRVTEEELQRFIESNRRGRTPSPWPEKTKPVLRHLRL
jgi:excisionase family DNA binding protein